MGILQTDLVPFSPTGPTVNIPSSKDVQVKVIQTSRLDTTAVLKAMLPADASLLGIEFMGSVASDAGTSATMTVTVANNAGTVSSGTYNVKTSGAVTGPITMSGIPNIQPIPLTGDLTVKTVYAETGVASTVGGPWNLVIYYVR